MRWKKQWIGRCKGYPPGRWVVKKNDWFHLSDQQTVSRIGHFFPCSTKDQPGSVDPPPSLCLTFHLYEMTAFPMKMDMVSQEKNLCLFTQMKGCSKFDDGPCFYHNQPTNLQWGCNYPNMVRFSSSWTLSRLWKFLNYIGWLELGFSGFYHVFAWIFFQVTDDKGVLPGFYMDMINNGIQRGEDISLGWVGSLRGWFGSIDGRSNVTWESGWCPTADGFYIDHINRTRVLMDF